jgi:hypothetical protein
MLNAGIFGQFISDSSVITCPSSPPVIDFADVHHGQQDQKYLPGHKLCFLCSEGFEPFGDISVGITECSLSGEWRTIQALECTLSEARIEGVTLRPDTGTQTLSPDFISNNCGPPPTQPPPALCLTPEVLEGSVLMVAGEEKLELSETAYIDHGEGEVLETSFIREEEDRQEVSHTMSSFSGMIQESIGVEETPGFSGVHSFFPVGSSVIYRCAEGYKAKGTEEEIIRICQKDGTWTGAALICEKQLLDCEKPPELDNAAIIHDRQNGIYQYVCHEGYKPEDQEAMFYECDHVTGTWKNKGPAAKCIPIPHPTGDENIKPTTPVCEEVPPVAHGSYSFENNTRRYIYTCQWGYDLVGIEWIECADGHWQGGPPYCDRTMCPDPGVPSHGRRNGNSFKPGDIVTYFCYTGYELHGSQRRECQQNRKWTGAPVTCDAGDNYCPVPVAPDGGWINGLKYNFGNKVTFTCEPGSVLIGSKVRTCLSSHKWSGEQPVCDAPLARDTNEEIRHRLDMILTDLVLKSHEGVNIYFAFDSSNSINDADFQKAIDFAVEVVGEVGMNASLSNGGVFSAVTFASNTKNISTISECVSSLECQNSLKAIQRGHYEGRGTNLKMSLGQVTKLVKHIRRMQTASRTGSKDILILFSDGMHNEGGSPIPNAMELKRRGVEIYAVSVKSQHHPLHMKEKLALIASSPSKDHVLFTTGYNWKHVPDYTQCGIPGRTPNVSALNEENTSEAGVWPWVAQLYVHRAKKNKYVLVCSAALVDPRHLLTAASCVKKMNFLNPPLVKFVSVDGIEDKNTQQRIVIDKQPFGGHHNTSVVMLKLDSPVNLNRNVKTICPMTKGVTEGYGVVLGWCSENKTSPFQLYQTLVSITSKNICGLPDIGAPDDNQFCIGRPPNSTQKCDKICTRGRLVMVEQVDLASRKSHWELAGFTVGYSTGCGLLNSLVGAYALTKP